MGKGRIAALAVALLATLLLLVSVDTRSAFAQELSLDDVTIQSFKIIDTTHGDAEIEYSLSSEASPKTDPGWRYVDDSSIGWTGPEFRPPSLA